MTTDSQTAWPARSSRFLLVVAGLVALAVGVGWVVGKLRPGRMELGEQPPTVEPVASVPAPDRRGELVYQVYCASCHGPEGHGDGTSAATLKPPPRDFAARPWRFEPTSETIRRVTLDGIPNTGMASFRNLPQTDLDAVVAHVHRLATDGPIIRRGPTEDERLLADAGFTDLIGTPPPPLAISNAAGRTVKLSDFAGRLVILHFWGTSCTQCIKEVPVLDRLERQHTKQLKVLHVCADEDDPAAAQKVLDRLAPGATALTDTTGLGLARYEVQAFPTVWLIAPDGTAIGRSSGARDWASSTQTKLIARWLPAQTNTQPGGVP